MFKYDFVYVVINSKGDIHNIFKKKENAIASIPEKIKSFRKEVSRGFWTFGEKGGLWSIKEIKVVDSNDLPYVPPR